MYDKNLKYQPVIYPDGMVAIHETIIDKDGTVKYASYDPVKLQTIGSMGDIESMLRMVYTHLRRLKPITEQELEALVYGVENTSMEIADDDDNVIDLVDYFSK